MFGDYGIQFESVTEDIPTPISRVVQAILQPFAEFSKYSVRLTDSDALVHHLPKKMLSIKTKAKDAFPPLQPMSAESSTVQLAAACMQYLLLEQFGTDMFPIDISPTSLISVYADPFGDLPDDIVYTDFWHEEDRYLNADDLFVESDMFHPEICDSIGSEFPLYDYASLHWTELLAACEEIAPEPIRDLARTLLDIDTANCRNWVHFYRNRGVTPIEDDFLDQDPIILASQFNLVTILERILSGNNSSPDIKTRALCWASRLGHDRIIPVLLREGAEPNSRGLENQTALTIAVENGNLSCVVALLRDERTNVNATGRLGRTALSFACEIGHDRIVEQMLGRNDCNVNAPDDSGATPFFWAVGGGHGALITILAKRHAANVNHRDRSGRTAISWAAGDGMTDTLLTLLRLKHVDVNIGDSEGRSPLSWASKNGCADTVEALLKSSRVDKSSVDQDGRTAICHACAGGHYQVLTKLLRATCAGVDTEDIDGWTPLAWAVQKNSPETIQALLKSKQVQLERRDRSGRTALSWAVEHGHINVVKVLLEAGADPETVSNRGCTPITVAKRFGRDDVFHELEAYASKSNPV